MTTHHADGKATIARLEAELATLRSAAEALKAATVGRHLKEKEMTPTTKLRFVKREAIVIDGVTMKTKVPRLILQQWWVPDDRKTPGEWADVPVEEEK